MKIMQFFLALLLLSSTLVRAENMIMLRVDQSFDNTMILMKEKLDEYPFFLENLWR